MEQNGLPKRRCMGDLKIGVHFGTLAGDYHEAPLQHDSIKHVTAKMLRSSVKGLKLLVQFLEALNPKP